MKQFIMQKVCWLSIKQTEDITARIGKTITSILVSKETAVKNYRHFFLLNILLHKFELSKKSYLYTCTTDIT